MGGISENDIILKMPVKLAPVGFLSFYVAFNVQCRAEVGKALEGASVGLSGLSCSWCVAQEAACIPAHAAGTNHPGPAPSSRHLVVLAKQGAGTAWSESDISRTCVNGTAACGFF